MSLGNDESSLLRLLILDGGHGPVVVSSDEFSGHRIVGVGYVHYYSCRM